jgi:hypothetical protein
MNRAWVASVVGVLALSVTPLFGGEKGEKKRGPDVPKAGMQEVKQLAVSGAASGRLIEVGSNTLTVRVAVPSLEAKQVNAGNVLRIQSRIVTKQQQILAAKNPVARAQRIRELAALQLDMQRQGGVKVRTDQMDFEVPMSDAVNVRLSELPTRYDHKGKIILPTAQEQKDLKGLDPKLPGYASSLDKLTPGQTVLVLVGKSKEEKKAALVTTVVILKDVDMPSTSKSKEKK